MNSSQFSFCMVIVMALARIFPSIGISGGILRTEITSKYVAAVISSFITGLTLPLQDLNSEAQQWDIQLLTQGSVFIFFPLLMSGLVFVLKYTSIYVPLLEGYKILGTLPPSISSAIMLTRQARGNFNSARISTVTGCLLGIFVTPILIVYLLGYDEIDVQLMDIATFLFLIIVLPLAVGQIIKNYLYRWLYRNKGYFTLLGQVVDLFIFYTTFCDTYSRTHFQLKLDTFSVVVTILILFCFHVTIMLSLFLLSRHIFWHYREETLAIMFVGSRKSLTLGLPILEIIFNGNPDLGCLTIPIVIYNPLQIILGDLCVELYNLWTESLRQHQGYVQ